MPRSAPRRRLAKMVGSRACRAGKLYRVYDPGDQPIGVIVFSAERPVLTSGGPTFYLIRPPGSAAA